MRTALDTGLEACASLIASDFVSHFYGSIILGHQEVMRLRFGHGLRSAEIASITGKRESAVRVTISRAMNLLRKIYEER